MAEEATAVLAETVERERWGGLRPAGMRDEAGWEAMAGAEERALVATAAPHMHLHGEESARL